MSVLAAAPLERWNASCYKALAWRALWISAAGMTLGYFARLIVFAIASRCDAISLPERRQ
jgi:hypothetical protein